MGIFDIFKKRENRLQPRNRAADKKDENNVSSQNCIELISSEKEGVWRMFVYKTGIYGHDFMLKFGQAFIDSSTHVHTACTSPMVNIPEEEHIHDLNEADNILRNCKAFNPDNGEENGYIAIGCGIHRYLFDIGTPLKVYLFNQHDFIKVYAIDSPDKEKQRETEYKLTSFMQYLFTEATILKPNQNPSTNLEKEFINSRIHTSSKSLRKQEVSKNWTKESIANNTLIFQDKGIIDVTNFEATSPDDSLGYMCGCDISVFANGQIEIYSDDSIKELLESFSILDIVNASNNINNYDPNHITEVSVLTQEKALRISFQNNESKTGFWNAIITLQSN